MTQCVGFPIARPQYFVSKVRNNQFCHSYLYTESGLAGLTFWESAGLVIERLWVRISEGAAGDFSSPESTLCADSYWVSVPTPVLPQWHVKDPGHSVKSAGGRLHLNTHALLIQRSRSGLTMPLSRHSVGIRKRAHTQLVRERWATVESARWATVDWSWPKEWN